MQIVPHTFHCHWHRLEITKGQYLGSKVVTMCFKFLSCEILCHFKSFCVIFCHFMSFHVMLCHVMSSYVMLCHVMSCYVILCHLMSCDSTHNSRLFKAHGDHLCILWNIHGIIFWFESLHSKHCLPNLQSLVKYE